MAHELFGERFWTREQPAWHNLGTVFPKEQKLTASEAFVNAGLDYEITTEPLTFKVDDQEIATNQYAVVRHAHTDPKTGVEDPMSVLGYVNGDYAIMSNMDLASHFDPLSKKWPVETVGSLKDGSTIFLTLAVGDGKIAGEDYQEYFLLTDTRDGSAALRMQYTPVRVVCQNTLTASLGGGTHRMAIPHTEMIETDLAYWKEVIVALKESQSETKEMLEAMAEFKLTDTQVKRLLVKTYPDRPKPKKLAAIDAMGEIDWSEDAKVIMANAEERWEQKRERDARHKLQVKYLYDKFADDSPKLANTAYAYYQAVAEREDHEMRQDGDHSAAALFGWRARNKQRAFTACTDLVKKN